MPLKRLSHGWTKIVKLQQMISRNRRRNLRMLYSQIVSKLYQGAGGQQGGQQQGGAPPTEEEKPTEDKDEL